MTPKQIETLHDFAHKQSEVQTPPPNARQPDPFDYLAPTVIIAHSAPAPRYFEGSSFNPSPRPSPADCLGRGPSTL